MTHVANGPTQGLYLFCELDPKSTNWTWIEIHLIVPDHLDGRTDRRYQVHYLPASGMITSENACVGDLATKFVSATDTC